MPVHKSTTTPRCGGFVLVFLSCCCVPLDALRKPLFHKKTTTRRRGGGDADARNQGLPENVGRTLKRRCRLPCLARWWLLRRRGPHRRKTLIFDQLIASTDRVPVMCILYLTSIFGDTGFSSVQFRDVSNRAQQGWCRRRKHLTADGGQPPFQSRKVSANDLACLCRQERMSDPGAASQGGQHELSNRDVLVQAVYAAFVVQDPDSPGIPVQV
jgi:hypothetical protein